MATDYRGRIAEVKHPGSPHFSRMGVVRKVKNGLFTVELSEGEVVFERQELRIKRITEDEYKARVLKGEDDLAVDAEADEVSADSMPAAVQQATGGEEPAAVMVTKGSRKAEPRGPTTKPRTEPKTHVGNTLEALSYPYTISLPIAYASLLERKTKGIYDLSMRRRFGRIYVTVESAEALTNLYNKLDTKRPSRQSRTILEGIRRSAK